MSNTTSAAAETITRDEIVETMEDAGYGVDIDRTGDILCDVSGSGADTRAWRLAFYLDPNVTGEWAWQMRRDGEEESGSLDSLSEVTDLCERFSAALSAGADE